MQSIQVSKMKRVLGHWALALPFLAAPIIATGCQTSTGRGAAGGAAAGALIGGIIGHDSGGHTAEGAAIGAALGAGGGAVAGHEVDKARRDRNYPDSDYSRHYDKERKQYGHYENRVVRSPNGEQYEERVWVVDPR